MTEPKARKVIAMPAEEPLLFSCEKITYWFFRLNGCLNLTNFLVHHERRDREGTEVDVLGVRFPYRNELALSGQSMDDHNLFTGREKKIDIIVADSKRGLCQVNRTWLLPELQNVERILLVLGVFPPDAIKAFAKTIYQKQAYEDEHFRINFYTLGSKKNNDLSPVIIQLTWDEVLLFIHERFVAFEEYKRQHDQWDSTGKELYELAIKTRKHLERFTETITSNMTP